MKIKLSKSEAKEKIDSFFRRKSFAPEDVRKTKRLAMKFNIKLGNYRKMFCKKCSSMLKGKLRVNKGWKSVSCSVCGFLNRHRIM